MMIKKEVRERLEEGALVFDNPAYDGSIIGQTFDGRAIYDIEKWQKSWQRMMNCLSRKPWTSSTITRLDPFRMREKRHLW